MAQAIRNIVSLATNDSATAQECIYSLPRDGKAIIGPSVRLAELIAQQWGNNRVATRITAVDRKEGFVEAEGIYHDLETNSAGGAKVRRSIKNKHGGIYSADMILVTGNAAAAIAKRNAILSGVPRPIWRQAYEKALGVVRGDVATLGERRIKLLLAFKELGVEKATVFRLIGVKGDVDIGLDEFVVLAGMHSAIKNGETTVDDLMGRVAPQPADRTLGSAFGEKRDKAKSDDPKPDATAEHDADGVVNEKPEGAGEQTEAGAADPKPELTGAAAAQDAGEGFQQGKADDAKPQAQVLDFPGDRKATAEPEPQGEAIDYTAAFTEYANAANELTEWGAIKKLLSDFRKTDAYQSAPAEMQTRARIHAYNCVVDANDPVSPESDPAFFRLWLLQAEPVEARPMFAKLIRSKAYQALDEDVKDSIATDVSAFAGEA
jgi:hypothetical protein